MVNMDLTDSGNPTRNELLIGVHELGELGFTK
jgi:hypothetical protein